MIQLLLHLCGDYILQPGKWANKKREQWRYAIYHGLTYGLFFLLMGQILPTTIFSCSLLAFGIITITHIIIDHTYPARQLIFMKNWIVNQSINWQDCKATGYPANTPAWLAVWLIIIVDNTLHLTINFFALTYL